MNTEPGEREEAPERFWIERQTQHAFTVRPDPYIETVEVGPVAEFNAHYEDLMRAALLREQNAATRMRERCAQKLRERASTWRKERYMNDLERRRFNAYAEEADNAAIVLESLTLDGEKEQTRS